MSQNLRIKALEKMLTTAKNKLNRQEQALHGTKAVIDLLENELDELYHQTTDHP